MDPQFVPIIVTVVAVLGAGLALVVFAARCYVTVETGQALIVNKLNRIQVGFTGALVVPLMNRAELIDISLKTIEVRRRGKDGIHCRDGVRFDLDAKFYVGVRRTSDDVLAVAQALGAARAGDQAVLEDLFAAKFSEALKTVIAQHRFDEVLRDREQLRDEVLQVIGADLDGFSLQDLAIDHLEPTPRESLDPNDVRDAEGIRFLTERTERARAEAAEIRADVDRRVALLESRTREVLLELERHEAEARAVFQRETGHSITREQLDDRLMTRLRELVDEALAERSAA